MASKTNSQWRLMSRQRIESALARLPADADLKAKRRAIRDAYPWGDRRGWPYQCWVKERLAALKSAKEPRLVSPEWQLRHGVGALPFYVVYVCGWCGGWPKGCLVCGPYHEALNTLLGSDFMSLLAAVRANMGDTLPRLVLADWLDERGFDRLAELFRETCEGKP